MQARFPAICCVCQSEIHRGDEIGIHPTIVGPQGGKKAAHAHCLEGHDHSHEAMENPLNEGYEIQTEQVGSQLRHHILFRGKPTGKYAMTAEKAEIMANKMRDGVSPSRLEMFRR